MYEMHDFDAVSEEMDVYVRTEEEESGFKRMRKSLLHFLRDNYKRLIFILFSLTIILLIGFIVQTVRLGNTKEETEITPVYQLNEHRLSDIIGFIVQTVRLGNTKEETEITPVYQPNEHRLSDI
ncbi:hypothetical protein JTB14_029203 [Gonioctena quinquepunctata]|nr:hypothetical protein JTB14_029203 [Gonioctena quinquepunctata]